MATSVKGSANSGKEKRGTSPSKPIIKKSPKASSSNQDEKISSAAADTTKPVPNYLKPTRSSNYETPSRVPKKSSSDSLKPELSRRRSFDRPPPSSQVQRAFRSPPSGPRDIKTQRSTSFTNKSSTPPSVSSTRPTSEKLYARSTSSLKDKKVEDSRISRSRSVKKSTLSSTSSRKEASSSSPNTKKPSKSMNSESSGDHENQSSTEHLATEEDDFVNLDEQEVQSLPEMSEMPDGNEELADPTNLGVEELKQVEEDPKGSPLETDGHHDHLHEVKSADVDDEVVSDEAAVDQEANGHQTVAEDQSADDLLEVEAAAEQNLVEGAEVEHTEAAVEEEESLKETVTEKVDQEETDEKQTDSSQPAGAAAAPAEATAAPANTQQSAADKKDKQAYNDVIEETATKLRGKKNKVLALAGAFETVISLQDTTKS